MDPGYRKDLNVKLRSLNKCQQRGSESFTAKSIRTNYTSEEKNLICLITQVRK